MSKEIEDFCVNLRNQNTRKMYYPGAARLQEMWVHPLTNSTSQTHFIVVDSLPTLIKTYF